MVDIIFYDFAIVFKITAKLYSNITLKTVYSFPKEIQFSDTSFSTKLSICIKYNLEICKCIQEHFSVFIEIFTFILF